MDEEIFLGADSYSGGPCDGTVPFPYNVDNVA